MSDQKFSHFPKLQLLYEMQEYIGEQIQRPLQDVSLVCVQHLLESNGSLIETLIRLGLPPERIYVLGKIYSNSEHVITKLRHMNVRIQESSYPKDAGGFVNSFQKDIATMWGLVYQEILPSTKSIVILDDGGHCLVGTPERIWKSWPVVGIEQTTSGNRQIGTSTNFPIVQVSSSAAKRFIEPPLISEAILNKLRIPELVKRPPARCGVIGLGSVGQAVAQSLRREGHRVFGFDRDPSQKKLVPDITWCNNINDILSHVEYVFSCTGEDITKGIIFDHTWINSITGNKTLISCSSEDIEFLSLIKYLFKETRISYSPLKDIFFRLPKGSFNIVRGGFPVNFDGSQESVPGASIQLTRALMFGAIIQAILGERTQSYSSGFGEMLEPIIQQFVVNRWIELQSSQFRYPKDLLNHFSNLDWIQTHSGGCYLDCPEVYKAFRR